MIWFKKAGWFYIPTSLAGWLITAFILVLCVHDFIAIDRHSHSVSDTYYHFLPFGFIYISTGMWIASNTSGNSKKQKTDGNKE